MSTVKQVIHGGEQIESVLCYELDSVVTFYDLHSIGSLWRAAVFWSFYCIKKSVYPQ